MFESGDTSLLVGAGACGVGPLAGVESDDIMVADGAGDCGAGALVDRGGQKTMWSELSSWEKCPLLWAVVLMMSCE